MPDIVKKALLFGAVGASGFVLLWLAKKLPFVGTYVGKLGV